jgi:1-acyl-sn-glycerol-3-phosphate acyltransferase
VPQSQNAIARDNRWPCIVVYPEGNTCNGRQICGFKARAVDLPSPLSLGLRQPLPRQLGPFQPGLPVQPMVISYARNKRMDPCWVEPAGLPVHVVAGRLLLQFHNFMEARHYH